MKELSFESGVDTYRVNGKCEVSFNPTDSAFVERLYSAFETLDKKQEGYKAQIDKISGKREIFDFAREQDAEMRIIIDGIFETEICKSVFGGVSLFALADGFPVWCNFLLSVMDEVDTTFTREQKATSPRVNKYVNKYRKK